MLKRVVCSSIVAVACCAPALSGGGAANNPHLRYSQEHHWTFSEIGDVGNAAATVQNWHPGDSTRQAGGVDYRYRISTTEVTWAQYHEFLQAYAPVMPNTGRADIVGRYTLNQDLGARPSPIEYLGPSGGVPQYRLDQARANEPATASWLYFARMVNWLHNGAPSADAATSADFEQGAYDTSTFGRVPDGPLGVAYRTDQDRRSPGARFWIPSGDELLKATHYDPDKDGDGQDGYWNYGNSSDSLPTPGDPALGGQTNAGWDDEYPAGQSRPLDVGSYADEQSPWGLLDGVGGGPEWTEEWTHFIDEAQQRRVIFDSRAFDFVDLAELFGGSTFDPTWLGRAPDDHYATLRLAAAIPSPGGALLLSFAALVVARRRR